MGGVVAVARGAQAEIEHALHRMLLQVHHRASFRLESGQTVPEAKADVLDAIYDRIVVTGRGIVSVRLTPSA